MRCLEAAFVMLLGWVFSVRKYRSSFRKKQDFYFANYRFPIRFVLFRFENYSRPPLRKNQQGKKSNIQMVRWKQLKQGVRLSIQQRLVVEHRVQSKMLEDWPSIAEGFPTLFSRVTINTIKKLSNTCEKILPGIFRTLKSLEIFFIF